MGDGEHRRRPSALVEALDDAILESWEEANGRQLLLPLLSFAAFAPVLLRPLSAHRLPYTNIECSRWRSGDPERLLLALPSTGKRR